MNTTISERSLVAIQKSRDELRRAADMLQDVLDRKTTLSDTGRAVGMTPQNLQRNLIQEFYPYIKTKMLSIDDLTRTLEQLRTPSDRFLLMIFGEDINTHNPHVTNTITMLPDYDPELLWNVARERLNEREYSMVRYLTGDMTGTPVELSELGKEFHLTRERVRMIIDRAFRKMRRPDIIQRIFPALTVNASRSMETVVRIVDDTFSKYSDALKKYYAVEPIKKAIEAYENGHEPDQNTVDRLSRYFTEDEIRQLVRKTVDNSTVYLSDIDRLSVRSYNCLTRAGYTTLNEVAELSTEDLMKIRNLGSKCIKEISEHIQEHFGFRLQKE